MTLSCQIFPTFIRSNLWFSVKVICLGLGLTLAHANDLPQIDAKTHPTTVLNRSTSQRVYVLKSEDAYLPPVGQILLLRDSTENILGVKVIKAYPEQNKYAARRVSLYSGHDTLTVDQKYTAVEKISDRIDAPKAAIVDTTQDIEADQTDLQDLEAQFNEPLPKPTADPLEAELKTPPPPVAEAPPAPQIMPQILPYDPELDLGTSPPPEDSDKTLYPTLDPDEQIKKISADEPVILDPDTHWVTLQSGVFMNYSASLGYHYYFGAGGRYGLTFARRAVLQSNTAQDSFTFELGVFNYRVVNYLTDNDAYTLLPVLGALRYNIHLSESFLFFGYLGFVYNSILDSTNPTASGTANLGSSGPTGGLGAMFLLGPKWWLRLDAGVELFGLGLVLRF